MYRNDIQCYVAVKQVLQLIETTFKNAKIITPFIPEIGMEERYQLITADNIPVSAMLGSFHNYAISEFLPLQIKRIGGSKETDFKSPILTIYGMMMSGIVLVCDGTTQKTHIYTLNPTLANYMCDNKLSITDVMSEIKEDIENTSKNNILCIEIIPVKINNTWMFQCQKAVFKLRTSSQIITYATSILLIRNTLMSKLKTHIFTIRYYDSKAKKNKELVTTLSQHTLSQLMNKDTYCKMISETIDETKAMTLKLPELNNIHTSNMVELFIPSIIDLTARPATLLMRDKFNPYTKKKKDSGGDVKANKQSKKKYTEEE